MCNIPPSDELVAQGYRRYLILGSGDRRPPLTRPLVTIIRELPFDVAADLVGVVRTSITLTPSDWHDTQGTKLLQDLIEAGETGAGLDLLDALLQPRHPSEMNPPGPTRYPYLQFGIRVGGYPLFTRRSRKERARSMFWNRVLGKRSLSHF